ncbi:MAG: histidinol-phosphatase [Tannerella sp.]|jgi:histidinol-phosphatase (PHP family)|nr:histidinol-phosphatase [Tannerella sp.]
MLPSNFHSHCTFCDGRNHPEDFIKFAIAKHFRAYGFSSHSPLPFETFWNMPASDMDEYITEINRLKEKYSDRIEIYLGMEIDYLDETYHANIPYFRSLPIDYRIGSIHFLPCNKPLIEDNMASIDGDLVDFKRSVDRYYQGDLRLITAHFFRNSMQMVETGGFDIVGHLDKIYLNGSRCPGFDILAPWYQKPLEAYIDLIAEKGLIVEINTKSFVGKKQTFPHLEILKLLHKHKIPVMVNSDCHAPDLVNDGRVEVLGILKETGFNFSRELVKGKWQDVSID